MIALSPALFVAAATGLAASDEYSEVPSGPDEFDPVLRDRHGPTDHRTSAAFIAHVGYWSHSAIEWRVDLAAAGERGVQEARGGRAVTRGAARSRAQPGRYLPPLVSTGEGIHAPRLLSMRGTWGARGRHDDHESPSLRSKMAPVVKSKVHSARRHRTAYCPALVDRIIAWVDLDEYDDSARVKRKGAA